MTNVTPRRSKRLQDGADSEDSEVLWDFGSASPKSRLDLCRQYDKIYHASNKELRAKIATWFPESTGQSSAASPHQPLYEPRVQPVAKHTPSTSRRKRAEERQRKKDKALSDLQAVVKEINQHSARASASPVLDSTPKLRRYESQGLQTTTGASVETVPCQLFTDVSEYDDVLKDINENVDDIFMLSQEELALFAAESNNAGSEPLPAAEVVPPAVAAPSSSAPSAQSSSSSGGSGFTACARSASSHYPAGQTEQCAATAAPAAAPTLRRSLSASSALSQQLCSSSSSSQSKTRSGQTTVSRPSPDGLPDKNLTGTGGKKRSPPPPLHKPTSAVAQDHPKPAHRSAAATATTAVPSASSHGHQRKPLASMSSQQRRCTQEEIERKRRLAKQKLLKRNFSTKHGTVQAAGRT